LSGDRAASTLPSMFTIHTTQTAPEGSREALAALERNIGFIPNLAGTIAGSPVALEGFVALQTALRGSRLSALEREVVGITVSRFNSCAYSLAAHSRFAAAAGGSPELIDTLRSGSVLSDARLESLRAFATAVLEDRGHIAPVELDAEESLEVLAQIAYTTLANHVANVSGVAIDDAFAALA
jgi:AhpD family alkylhydroperoxidase